MRIFLLPISTRRTLLYCQRNADAALPAGKQPVAERVAARAARLWASWERRDDPRCWQRQVADRGNRALRRVPFEEWGLKSVPPLSVRRREEDVLGAAAGRNDLVYPAAALARLRRVVGPSTSTTTTTAAATTTPTDLLRTLASERESWHRSRLIWCLVGMPLSAPFALVPIIPNLPFFYLVYRAWSHWRAIAGGKHLRFLLDNNLLAVHPSPALDAVYPSTPLLSSSPPSAPESGAKASPSPPDAGAESASPPEVMLLDQASGRKVVDVLDIPELEVELERAVWQVEDAITKGRAAQDKSAHTGDTRDKKS